MNEKKKIKEKQDFKIFSNSVLCVNELELACDLKEREVNMVKNTYLRIS